VDQAASDAALKSSVAEVVRQQVKAGIDIPNDGEFGKSTSWSIFRIRRRSECRPAGRYMR